MSETKGITVEMFCGNTKDKLISDYESCKRDLAEIRQHNEEIRNMRNAYSQKITRYRIDSVSRILDFIRREYRAGRVCDLEKLLCHCQNKLSGNIDGVELDLDEHLRGVPF